MLAPSTPAQAPAPPPSAPGLDEHTKVHVTPPPVAPRVPVPPATPPPPLDESTRLAAKPPPLPKPPPAPAAPAAGPTTTPLPTRPAPAAPPPAGGGGDFTEHTILLSDLQPQVASGAKLQRMAPPGRSDIVSLDRTHYLLGRLPSCDLRLYSQTASREHAQLSLREGRWYLTPVTGKLVLVNGTQVKEEVPLTHKMRLQLGGDELLFLDESGVTAIREAPAVGTTALSSNRWLVIALGLGVLAAVLWSWASR